MNFRIPRFLRRAATADEAPAQPSPPAADGAPAPAEPFRSVSSGTSSFSVPVTYMDSRIPEVDSAFGYGHLDGSRGVEPAHFLEFIGHTVASDGHLQLLETLQKREQALRDEAAEVRRGRAEVAAGEQELRSLAARREAAERDLKAAEAQHQQAEAESRANAQHASLSHAAIYLLAALFFVLGDVVMSRRIVADALELTGQSVFGVDESWMFAIGLAMISILLKPAYDRLVEKPFWEGNEKRFFFTIAAAALLSGVTLYSLGAFRAEAHGIQSQINNIVADAGTQAATDGGAQASGQATAINALRDRLLNSASGRLSFILSGLLFAAAGAISISIGLRYVREHVHVRRPARRRARAGAKALADARHDAVAVRDTLATRSAELERLRAQLADRPPAAELESRADEVRTEARAIFAELVPIRRGRLQSLYRDGYELGRTRPDGESAPDQPGARRPRKKRTRPYVALRRAIRELSLRSPQVN